LAQQAAEQIKLQEVRFIPAGEPYHRAPALARPTSGEHRAEMVRRAIRGNELFRLDTRDLERSGPTYTYDTLAGLRGEVGEQVSIVVLLGADAFALLETWHRWRELFGLCHFAVAQRPGAQGWRERIGSELAAVLREREQGDARQVAATAAGSVLVIEMTPLEISATAIRAQLRDGASPRYLLPDAVLEYIVANQLYLEGGR
jgi:nicotinate-nucleotide adenylyltransferase